MQLQISGQITGLEARNGGWVAVAITEPGNEWPKKLSTKKPDLIGMAQSMMGQVVTALYNEQEGNSINPHTGTPYVNRYLEALALGASAPQVQPMQVQPAPVMQQPVMPQPVMQPMVQQQPQTFAPQPIAVGPDLRETKIMRQAASKVAVNLLQHLDEGSRNLASLVAISEQLVKYYNEGVQWNVAPVAAPVAPQPVAQPAQAEYQPGADDDIPF
jgi:hypothetical protein